MLRDAVERELSEMGVIPPGMAASALAMAEALDRKPSAMMFQELRMTLESLHRLAPPKRESDPIDDLATRRANRHAG